MIGLVWAKSIPIFHNTFPNGYLLSFQLVIFFSKSDSETGRTILFGLIKKLHHCIIVFIFISIPIQIYILGCLLSIICILLSYILLTFCNNLVGYFKGNQNGLCKVWMNLTSTHTVDYLCH